MEKYNDINNDDLYIEFQMKRRYDELLRISNMVVNGTKNVHYAMIFGTQDMLKPMMEIFITDLKTCSGNNDFKVILNMMEVVYNPRSVVVHFFNAMKLNDGSMRGLNFKDMYIDYTVYELLENTWRAIYIENWRYNV